KQSLSLRHPQCNPINITNTQADYIIASVSHVSKTTNDPANTTLDYVTCTANGSSTTVDSAMLTSHQVTLSGLAAGTTYYYQVSSTDSKGNHGKSGGHSVKTAGFSISGASNPASGGSRATLTRGGAANATTRADG